MRFHYDQLQPGQLGKTAAQGRSAPAGAEGGACGDQGRPRTPALQRRVCPPHDLRDDFYIDDPHNPQTGANAFGGNLYIDPNRVLRLSKPGIRKEALLQGMGYVVGVMPPKDSEESLRSIPLEGCSFYFGVVTNSQTPAQPELERLIQLCKQYLDEAYPDY